MTIGYRRFIDPNLGTTSEQLNALNAALRLAEANWLFEEEVPMYELMMNGVVVGYANKTDLYTFIPVHPDALPLPTAVELMMLMGAFRHIDNVPQEALDALLGNSQQEKLADIWEVDWTWGDASDAPIITEYNHQVDIGTDLSFDDTDEEIEKYLFDHYPMTTDFVFMKFVRDQVRGNILCLGITPGEKYDAPIPVCEIRFRHPWHKAFTVNSGRE